MDGHRILVAVSVFLKERARSLGFQAAAVTSAEALADAEEVTLRRIDGGLMAGLDWFTPTRARLACRPQELLPGAKSVLTLAASYFTNEPEASNCDVAPRGRVARYAWGRDYHDVLRARLQTLVDALALELGYRPGSRFFVDSSPLSERAAAQRSGLGWFGKNTNILVHGVGPWGFLASILLDIALPPAEPLLTHCGSCNLCIEACPTGALIDPYTLDNTRCISFQTIENRGSIPSELRPLLGNWVYGCDICQEVCPVNKSAVSTTIEEFMPVSGEVATPSLTKLLEMDTRAYQARFRGSAMKRAKQAGLQRNAAVALGNTGDEAAVPFLAPGLSSPQSIVRSHSAWAMGRIGGKRARKALERAHGHEQDTAVLAEIASALDELS